MQVHAISAYETTAEAFFAKLAEWKTDLVLDARLKNTNQLNGFTKEEDLEYFCKVIQHCDYVHDTTFSPENSILEPYLDHKISYEDFFAEYKDELQERDALPYFFKTYGEYDSIAIVGTATKKRHSHVEVLVKLIDEKLAEKD